MLTLPPPRRPVDVPHGWTRLRHVDWDRGIVCTVAAFHLVSAAALALAPAPQVLNAGTAPALALMPREAWAVWFLLAGVAAVFLAVEVTVVRQLATWLSVVPIGFAWAGSLCIALLNGAGSVIAAAGWITLLVLWGISAIRIALHTD